MTAEVVVPDGDFLAHYGKKGMKWGEHRAKAKENHNNIMQARANQAYRGAEINQLTAKRIGTTSAKGKQHLDSVIADKKFALQNHPDAATASRLTTGEKWLKGAKVAGIVGMSLVGFGAVAGVVNSELSRYENMGSGARMTKEWADAHQMDPKIRDVSKDPYAQGQAMGLALKNR